MARGRRVVTVERSAVAAGALRIGIRRESAGTIGKSREVARAMVLARHATCNTSPGCWSTPQSQRQQPGGALMKECTEQVLSLTTEQEGARRAASAPSIMPRPAAVQDLAGDDIPP